MNPASRSEDRAGAHLTVDLAAILANWRLLKGRAGPACDMGAVVKADAYGTGAGPVAAALKEAGCKTFYVALLEEAVALRAAVGQGQYGMSPRIVVFNGPNAGTERDFANYGLIPVLNTPEQIRRWRAFADKNDLLMESIVHVDTGMNRLGLSAREFETLLAEPDGFLGLHPLALMSHLACADTPDHPLNQEQLSRFAAALSAFRGRFPDAKGTLANSAGVFLGPPWHHDFARPGVALFGGNPAPDAQNPMVPVVRLMAKILQVRRVDRAGTVGYGATARVPDGAKLATASIGYADGLLRCFGQAGAGYIDGLRVPVVGRVSMDLTVFDVSAVPDSALAPGAMIEVLGPRQTVDDVARAAGTIGYEILTSLGARYHRRHLPPPKSLKA